MKESGEPPWGEHSLQGTTAEKAISCVAILRASCGGGTQRTDPLQSLGRQNFSWLYISLLGQHVNLCLFVFGKQTTFQGTLFLKYPS